jgi:hypothetical protein
LRAGSKFLSFLAQATSFPALQPTVCAEASVVILSNNKAIEQGVNVSVVSFHTQICLY